MRWHAGTKYAEEKDVDFKRNHEPLYKNRSRLQPYVRSCFPWLFSRLRAELIHHALAGLVRFHCVLLDPFLAWMVSSDTSPQSLGYTIHRAVFTTDGVRRIGMESYRAPFKMTTHFFPAVDPDRPVIESEDYRNFVLVFVTSYAPIVRVFRRLISPLRTCMMFIPAGLLALRVWV